MITHFRRSLLYVPWFKHQASCSLNCLTISFHDQGKVQYLLHLTAFRRTPASHFPRCIRTTTRLIFECTRAIYSIRRLAELAVYYPGYNSTTGSDRDCGVQSERWHSLNHFDFDSTRKILVIGDFIFQAKREPLQVHLLWYLRAWFPCITNLRDGS